MLQKIFTELRYRHFWRKATYSELAGFYVAELLRAMALNLATLFIFSFLFVKGYSLIYVVIFMIYYQLLMLIFSVLAIYGLAYFGANRCLLVSNILYIPALLLFSMLDQWGEITISLGGLILALSTILHNTAYNVLFSEVKSSQNCGKEVGYMVIFQKLAGVIAPLIGGALATWFGAEVTMWVAAGLFVVAALSLINAQAVAKKRHYLNFRGFPWRAYASLIIGQFGRGFEVVGYNIWPFFMFLFVLPAAGAYQVVGGINALNALVMFGLAFGLGRLLDKLPQRVPLFFRLGIMIQALIIASRVLVRSLWGAVISESGGALATLTYTLPYSKARFDAADKSGSRVVMELAMSLVWNLGALVAAIALLACLVFIKDTQTALSSYFLLAAIVFGIFGLSDFPLFRVVK